MRSRSIRPPGRKGLNALFHAVRQAQNTCSLSRYRQTTPLDMRLGSVQRRKYMGYAWKKIDLGCHRWKERRMRGRLWFSFVYTPVFT